uniref:Tetraspanin n=1 Tax=Elaeophora elaphi TaxID=1147741 RepID=A0A0R3RZH6_9BILA
MGTNNDMISCLIEIELSFDSLTDQDNLRRSEHLKKRYEIPFKFHRNEKSSLPKALVRNRRSPYKVFRLIMPFTTALRLLICIAVLIVSLNFTFKYVQPLNRFYATAKPTFSAQILIKCLGLFTYAFCGLEAIQLAVQFVSFIAFMKQEYAFYGISIAVDFALLFLVLLFYLLLTAIGFNSSEVSSSLIGGGTGTLLKYDPQKLIQTVDEIQRIMHCCDFVGSYTEWIQNKTIYYYDALEDMLKVMLDDKRKNILKPQNDEAMMNFSTLFCCSESQKHCSKERTYQQSCRKKLSVSIAWLMNSIGIALTIKLLLSVLQEAIFTYFVIDITQTNFAIAKEKVILEGSKKRQAHFIVIRHGNEKEKYTFNRKTFKNYKVINVDFKNS